MHEKMTRQEKARIAEIFNLKKSEDSVFFGSDTYKAACEEFPHLDENEIYNEVYILMWGTLRFWQDNPTN